MVRSTFRNLGSKSPNLLSFGKKNKWIYFVLLSFFRNIAEKSAKLLSLGKKTNEFVLFCSRFSVTLRWKNVLFSIICY